MGKIVWRKILSGYKFKVFIGYDSREDIAYQIAKHSIEQTCKYPEQLEIQPLKLKDLIKQGHYTRDVDPLASTEFTFSRFLVPHLCNYNGWALFIDCDFLFTTDIRKLFQIKDDRYAVMCAQHDYTPKAGTKMDGKEQHIYPRKNWSSMVLWNCGHPANKSVTKELVNNPDTTGQYLHRFSWLDDSDIGVVSHEWNWLTDWYKEPQDGAPKALHYTEGGPWFKEYERCDYAVDWLLAEKQYLRKKAKEAKQAKPDGPLHNVSPEHEEMLTSMVEATIDPEGNYYGKTFNIVKERADKLMSEKIAAIDSTGGFANTQGLPFDPILASFVKGSGGVCSNWDREKDTDRALVIRGLGGGSRKALHYCWKTGRTYYAIDTGYLGNIKNKYLHRITKNGLQYTGPIKLRPMDRARKFGYRFKKFSPGSKILICPPSVKVMTVWGENLDEWVASTVKELKKYTDREIEIRLKPSRTDRISTDTIQDALANDVHCLVTYNSIAACEALMEGKPALVLGNNAASVVAETEIQNIDAPRVPDRETMEAWISNLAYCQFTTEEMKSGFAWRTVNETCELPEWHPTSE